VINALRGHLAESGQIVPQGAANAARLIAFAEDPGSGLSAEIQIRIAVFNRYAALGIPVTDAVG
jgi:transposase